MGYCDSDTNQGTGISTRVNIDVQPAIRCITDPSGAAMLSRSIVPSPPAHLPHPLLITPADTHTSTPAATGP